MPDRTVVLIVAHPDDVAHSFGGTALLLKERYRLHVICASRGERGYGYEAGAGRPPNAELAARREAEERAACALLGASLSFLDLIDGEIFATRAAIGRTAAELRELRPAAVLTHGPLAKIDHSAVSMIALQALQQAKLFWEAELYYSLWPGETLNGSADLYVDISPVIEGKRALVACHPSQNPDPATVASRLERNAVLGRFAWCDYAEAYMSGLPLMGRRWNRRAGSILLDLGN